jgi:hypothetical protein
MRILLRVVAIVIALSMVLTIWFIVAFTAAGGAGALLGTGWLGALTLVGWFIGLVWLRGPGADSLQIVMAAGLNALPLLVLHSPAARQLCRQA